MKTGVTRARRRLLTARAALLCVLLLPLMSYTAADATRPWGIADVAMIAVELEQDGETFRVRKREDGRPVFQPLEQESAYIQVFGSPNNVYHPNEAAAEAFTNIVILDSMPDSAKRNPRVQRQQKAMEPVRKWFLEHLRQADAQ